MTSTWNVWSVPLVETCMRYTLASEATAITSEKSVDQRMESSSAGSSSGVRRSSRSMRLGSPVSRSG